METKSIDVAKIMREIRESIIHENASEGGFVIDERKNPHDVQQELERIYSFIANTRRTSSEHLDIGMKLPDFHRFNILLRRIFIFIARLIRKATFFITKDQMLVNHNTDACIQALIECNMELQQAVNYLNGELAKMRASVNPGLKSMEANYQYDAEHQDEENTFFKDEE